jgi:hypothetical protein
LKCQGFIRRLDEKPLTRPTPKRGFAEWSLGVFSRKVAF